MGHVSNSRLFEVDDSFDGALGRVGSPLRDSMCSADWTTRRGNTADGRKAAITGAEEKAKTLQNDDLNRETVSDLITSPKKVLSVLNESKSPQLAYDYMRADDRWRRYFGRSAVAFTSHLLPEVDMRRPDTRTGQLHITRKRGSPLRICH